MEAFFYVDYRIFNASTLQDSYPVPRMDECNDSLGSVTIFSISDANSQYFQMELDERDKDRAASIARDGLHRCMKMLLGLKNYLATFQREIDVILASVKWHYMFVYIYNIIVFSTSPTDHARPVKKVLKLIKYSGMALKLKKCHFSDSMDYLGHVITPGRLQVAKIQGILSRFSIIRRIKMFSSPFYVRLTCTRD